jgi:hypothetical protein
MILSPIFDFSALDIPRKNGEKLLKFHSSLIFTEWFAFLGIFRFFSPVNGKEKDDFRKLYHSLWTMSLKDNAKHYCLWLDYSTHTKMYVENPKIEVYMNFGDISLIIFELYIKNHQFFNIHFCMLTYYLNIQKCMLINIHFCMLFLSVECVGAVNYP